MLARRLMLGKAEALGVNPQDALGNIHGIAVHLRTLLDHYEGARTRTRYVFALAAYNAGRAAVDDIRACRLTQKLSSTCDQ